MLFQADSSYFLKKPVKKKWWCFYFHFLLVLRVYRCPTFFSSSFTMGTCEICNLDEPESEFLQVGYCASILEV